MQQCVVKKIAGCLMNDHLEFIKSQKLVARNNIDTSSRCTLRCSTCQRAGLLAPKDSTRYAEIKTKIDNGFDLPLEDAKKLLTFFDRGVMLCGQQSDPIFWINLFDFLEFSKSYPNKYIRIRTAASQKNIEWYRTAFELSHKNVIWIFGLDGLKDTSMIYRVGQNSELLFDAMILGKRMGVNIRWSFIVFKHNEHQLDQAKKFAREYKIHLEFVKSNRSGVEVPINWIPKKHSETVHYDIV